MDLKLGQRFLPYAAIASITILFSLWCRRSRRCRAKSGRSNVGEDGFQYDVFLSFRGPDTRKTFVDLLHKALEDKGIITFIDSEKLEKGQKLEVLLECVQRSKIFVPIFSPGYADSEWCLKQIYQMVECKRVIVPVFVDVEPTDVRRQTGPFGSAFSKHRRNKEIDETEVSNWSNALKEAGSASGYTLGNTHGYLGKLIQQIVKRILSEVNKTSKLHVAQHPVGLDSRIVDVIKMLETEAQDDARIVGIGGMGGLGKTTLSKAVYNEISSRFDAHSFISNVREAARRPSGLVSLQKQLLGDVFNDKDVTISNTSDGLGQIKERIGAKKVLLVLDDVSDVSQINELVGELAWFRSGSRIIITTRYMRVLTLAQVKQDHVYMPYLLDHIQSLELFNWHAFGKKEPDAKFAYLFEEVVSIAAGLPLALIIFGSHFFDLTAVEDWHDMLIKLRENIDNDIYKRLRISFDVLDVNEKKVFLDIACFFVGQETKRATCMWEACGFSPETAINWLIHKSLVSINNEGKFEMHDFVRDMGRKIVQVMAKETGNYSRLWENDETVDVLQNKRGTENVEAIKLFCERKDSVYVDVEYLAAMSQLRMLLLQDVTLKGGYEHFPRTLRWLKWSSQALEEFPSSLYLQVFNHLKILDLSGCRNLSVCPDFASMIHLEMLSFDGCWKMSELHPSIGLLECLTQLSLRECMSLKELPQEVSQLTELEEFDLSYCFKITTFPSLEQHLLGKLKILKLGYCRNLTMCPDFMGMPHLEILDFEACWKMSEFCPSIGHLRSLTSLSLHLCESLKEVPQDIWQLTSLQVLDLSGCNQIPALPSRNAESLKQPLLERLVLSYCSSLIMCPDFTGMPHLQELYFRGCEKITELDPSLGQLQRLTDLDLRDCKSLKGLPQEIGQLTSLKWLALDFCSQISTLPQSMGHLKQLQQLSLSDCSSLKEVPECIMSLDQLRVICIDDCEGLKFLPSFPPSLNVLDASHCHQLEIMADVSNLKGLERLYLSGCTRLNDIPGIEYLKCLKSLYLGGCRRLAGSLFERVQDLDIDRLEELELCNWEDLTKRPDVASLLNWLSKLNCLRKLDLSWTDIEEQPALEGLGFLSVIHCDRLKSLPRLPPSFTELNATWCTELSMIEDVSSMDGLTKLNLTGCRKLVHIPGVEQLKRLEKLELAGCRSLHDSFFEKLQEANFQHMRRFSIPGRLINDGLSNPQFITFILPKQFHFGLLCLYVDQRSLDNICLELAKNNSASALPDKSITSEDEVTQLADRQLGRLVVRIDITTDDAQFSFLTFVNGWNESRRFPRATFARDSELMMMADQGRFKGNDVDDAQGTGMMEMRVSIDGCILLHGDLLTTEWIVTDKDLDACRVGDNIVQVKFG